MPSSHRAFLLPLAAVVVAAAAPRASAAQAQHVLGAEADLVKEPSGTALARLARNTPVLAGAVRATWQEVTVDGWIVANALRDDKRDGFDVAVNLAAGTAIRAGIGVGAVLGTARAGALFDRVETRSGWVHVRRTGWVPKSAVQNAPAKSAATPPPSAPPAGAATPTAKPPAAAPAPGAAVTVAAGTIFSGQANGSPIGSVEVPAKADVLEQRNGWTHVKIDAWVRDAAVGGGPSGGITAADLRADPDKYVGQTVEWTVQLIGVQKADELRPELPVGQPYLLARGPLPETGFVYLVVKPEEAETFRTMEPLTKMQVRATIRAGKSRFLSTPVLNFVRRLD